MPSGPIACPVLPALFLAALLMGPVPSAAAQATIPVDVELVIAVDVSVSMDREERQLQRDGFVMAFRDPAILAAIHTGETGRIAVTVMEWAGELRQNVIVPWTLIDGEASAFAFADQLERRLPGRMANGTAIGSALLKAASLFGAGGHEGARRVINISSDGINNRGPDPAGARDELVSRGITINALPIVYRGLIRREADQGAALLTSGELTSYFASEVIGGPGAFLEPVAGVEQFRMAIHRKLLREISAEPMVAQLTTRLGPVPPKDWQPGLRQASVAGEGDIRMAATTWPIAARSSAEGPPR